MISGPSPLHEPTAADRAAAEVRKAIVTGEIRPGQPVPVTDIAERHGARRAALLRKLARLEYDGLVNVRGDSAVATVLNADEMFAMIRLAGALRVELFERATRLAAPSQLDLVLGRSPESVLTPVPGDDSQFTGQSVARARKQLIEVDHVLYGLAATRFEIHVLDDVRLALRRYFLLGLSHDRTMSAVAATSHDVSERYLELRHELLTNLRAGRASAMRELADRHTRYHRLIDEQSLIRDYVTDRTAGPVPAPRVAYLRAL